MCKNPEGARMSRYSDAISDFAENEDCSPVDAVAVNPVQNTGHYAEPELTRKRRTS
jgi:hypothetical protein